jgi:AcrR family transcriptional regulator
VKRRQIVLQRTARRRGRPSKGDEAQLHDALLDHAVAQFMAAGYRSTTMASIASSFGVAKSTLFRKYGSKAGLLHAVMKRGVPALAVPLRAIETEGRSPLSVLRAFGEVIQKHDAEPQIRAIWQALSEARDMAEPLEDVLENEGIALAPISTYLEQLVATKLVRPIDPMRAAAAFAALVSGGLPAFLGPPQSAWQIEARLDFALEFTAYSLGLKTV